METAGTADSRALWDEGDKKNVGETFLSLEDKPLSQSQSREAAGPHSIHFSVPVCWNHLHSSLKNCCSGQRKHRSGPLSAKCMVEKQQLCASAVRQEQYLQRWKHSDAGFWWITLKTPSVWSGRCLATLHWTCICQRGRLSCGEGTKEI